MATRYADGTWKLDLEQVEKNFRMDIKEKGGKAKLREEMQALRVSIYTMIGGGMIGELAVNRPNQFYIDARVGKLPYKNRSIHQAVDVLKLYVKVLGLTPDTMPRMPHFHNCGLF